MIELARPAHHTIVDHALDAAPAEACGILGGSFDREVSRVRRVEPAENAASVPEYEYAIDPTEQLALMERLEDAGEEVVGFYHSHPDGPPGPSQTDADRATWPDRSYVIVVLGGHPFVGSWRWNGTDERFEQEIVRLTSRTS